MVATGMGHLGMELSDMEMGGAWLRTPWNSGPFLQDQEGLRTSSMICTILEVVAVGSLSMVWVQNSSFQIRVKGMVGEDTFLGHTVVNTRPCQESYC